MEVVGIRGERIRLVPADREKHLDNFVRWFNDPEVTCWLQRNMPLSRMQEEKWFERVAESDRDIVWAVYDENDRHIGVTGIHNIDWKDRFGVTGTVIGEKEVWGQGYGSDVMRTRTRWAFEELGLHRLESECFAENTASIRCLEKAGYCRIGVARKKRWRNGHWHDCILWEILDEDYFRAR